MLDVKVTIERLCQRDLRKPALQLFLLVAHLVRGIDTHPAQHADRRRDAQLGNPADAVVEADPAEVRGGEVVGAQEEARVLERNEDVGAIAVVLVVLQRLHHLIGRVLTVSPEIQVQQRQDHVDQQRADPEEDR
ncbi:Uncharacterised protein [Mycobacteroides abscessus subsp. massiliense]|nr:Uncharacterised protein [Mycobacteroides abscessus subsp. massiliense]